MPTSSCVMSRWDEWESWEIEKNMQFSGFRLSLPEAGNSSPWKRDLWSTTSRTLHAIISGMRETRQASVFAVLAPPPYWGAPWLDAKPRDVWAVHCCGTNAESSLTSCLDDYASCFLDSCSPGWSEPDGQPKQFQQFWSSVSSWLLCTEGRFFSSVITWVDWKNTGLWLLLSNGAPTESDTRQLWIWTLIHLAKLQQWAFWTGLNFRWIA